MGAEQSAFERALRGVSDDDSALYADMPELGVGLDGPADERVRSNVRVTGRMKGASLTTFERDILKANAVARVVADELGVLLSFEAIPRVKNRDIVKLFWKQRQCMVVKVVQKFATISSAAADVSTSDVTNSTASATTTPDNTVEHHGSTNNLNSVGAGDDADAGAGAGSGASRADDEMDDDGCTSVYAAPRAFYLLFLMLEDMLQGVQASSEIVPRAQPVADFGCSLATASPEAGMPVSETETASGVEEGGLAYARLNSSVTTSTGSSAFVDAESVEDECPICLDRMVQVVLPCSHSICQKCYDDWMKEQKNCPLCRSAQSNQDDLWVLTAPTADSAEDHAMARTHKQATKTRILNFLLHLPDINGHSMRSRILSAGKKSGSANDRNANHVLTSATARDSGYTTDTDEHDDDDVDDHVVGVEGRANGVGVIPQPMLVLCPNAGCRICFAVPIELVSSAFACPVCRHVARLPQGSTVAASTDVARRASVGVVAGGGLVVPHTPEEEQAQLAEALSRSVVDTNYRDDNVAGSIIQL